MIGQDVVTRDLSALPAPRADRFVRHLGRWGVDPLALLTEGATLGGVFRLNLWEPVVVGYTPSWNKAVFTDLATFRNQRSLIRLSPHLNGGIVMTDHPHHRPRRTQLAPGFSGKNVRTLSDRIDAIVQGALPGPGVTFDAVEFSSALMLRILSDLFLGLPQVPPLVQRYLRPLERPLPAPFVPHPVRTARVRRFLRRSVSVGQGPLSSMFAGPDGVEDLRVCLAAGYDTTAHTVAWLLAHAAREPSVRSGGNVDGIVKEVLRLYPSGWMGSRRAARTVVVDGVRIPQGTLVFYSPYLTHRDPALWERPERFAPDRHTETIDVWQFVPFAGGPRICLGRFLAQSVVASVLTALDGSQLRYHGGDVRPRASVTMGPRGPVLISRDGPPGPH